ncbi:MAG: hypothetical protein IT560_12325 [Alphaproteobacteria bacterium]|nr:hypothetical protein [Alphaproteobacteria bacterium]
MTAEILWKSDASGMILGSRVHDARMLSHSYSEEKKFFSAEFRREDGSKMLLELHDISELNIHFWGGEIVMDMATWPVAKAPQAWTIPDSPWNSLYVDRVHDVPIQVQHVIDKNPENFLFEMTCSYGGGLTAVCRQIKFFEM